METMGELGKYFGEEGREVAVREFKGAPAAVVTITRVYDTTVEDVWNCLTDPERLPRWFMGVTGDLKEGGEFHLERNASGVIERCDAPNALDLQWGDKPPSWVHLRLSKVEGRAQLVLEHIAHIDERWPKFGPGAVGVGWDLALMGLGWHIGSGATADHEAAMKWTMSDAGKAVIRESSKQWCEASIASGVAREEAEAAAANTTAFYTGAA